MRVAAIVEIEIAPAILAYRKDRPWKGGGGSQQTLIIKANAHDHAVL